MKIDQPAMRKISRRNRRRRDALPPPQIALTSARLDAKRNAFDGNPAGAVAAGADCGDGGRGFHVRVSLASGERRNFKFQISNFKLKIKN
jgi:hypothetical protein